jgi:hypothetical protein
MPEPQDFSPDMNSADLNPTDLNGLSVDDRNLERLLKSLVPRESRLNRDRVMYLAGHASAVVSHRTGSRWLWPAATACSACAGLVIGLLLAHVRPAPAPPFAMAPQSTEKLLRREETASERPSQPMPAATHEPIASSGLRLRTPILGTAELGTSELGTTALNTAALNTAADDPNRLVDSFAFGKTAAHLQRSATYPELLRQLLAEQT